MAQLNHTFNIDLPSHPLNEGDKLFFKFSVLGTSTNNFTASISQGSAQINSLSLATGYATTTCPYFDSASIANPSNTNEIIFSQGISSFYDEGYIFTPNPLSGSISSLYPVYGDVDYEFTLKPYDIVIIYLSDNTYLEYRILDVYKGTNNLLRITLDAPISNFVRSNLAEETYKRFLLLTRKDDETNIYLTFTKRPGQTSYGFIVSDNISVDILDNIDTNNITEDDLNIIQSKLDDLLSKMGNIINENLKENEN